MFVFGEVENFSKKDLKDLDRFERFTFPRFANSLERLRMLHIRLERLRMLHIRDRWFSPQATEKKGVRFAQKSHKSFQIKQIRRIKRDLKDLNRFERFLAVGDLKIECALPSTDFG